MATAAVPINVSHRRAKMSGFSQPWVIIPTSNSSNRKKVPANVPKNTPRAMPHRQQRGRNGGKRDQRPRRVDDAYDGRSRQ